MTVPVPAGAGGVDRNQVRPSHVLIVGARITPAVIGMVQDVERALVAAVRAEERERLAAAEQRADTAAADERVRIADEIEAARSCSACADFYSGKPTARHDLELGCAPTCPCNHEHARWVGYSDGALTRIAAQVRAALSSRPVQPDTERSET